MPLSGLPHSRLKMLDDCSAAIAVIHAALDAGVRLLDTADIYAAYWDQFGHNEALVGEAVRTWNGTESQEKETIMATKGGITRGPGETWGRAVSVDYLLRAAEVSALRLGVEQIQLWQHHRLDPIIPFETQFENILVLQERGIVKEIGVSNYNAKQLEVAITIAGKGGVVSVQNKRSPKYLRDSDVLAVCEKMVWRFCHGHHSVVLAPVRRTAHSRALLPLSLQRKAYLHMPSLLRGTYIPLQQ